MIQTLRERVARKNVLILGFGREGKSTYEALRTAGSYASLAVADQNPRLFLPEPEVSWITGEDYQKTAGDFDLVFKSPGVALEKETEKRLTEGVSGRLTSQTQEFFSLYRDQVTGVTGTKGKSTTATLLYHILKENGIPCLLAGNIGIPVFDISGQTDRGIPVICELSCHQLEYMSVSPAAGILTNIYEEHLDRYGTMEKYVASKKNIYLHQRTGDIFFCNSECLPEEGENCGRLIPVYGGESPDTHRPQLERRERNEAGREKVSLLIRHTTVYFDGNVYEISLEQTKFTGEHNCFDIGIVYALCHMRGISDQDFTRALRTYEPLPHRLQYVGCYRGIKYYDDSISTICETAIRALHSVKDTDSILIGGMDRGIEYADLIRELYRFPRVNVILMEATGRRIEQEIREKWKDFPNMDRLYLARHLEDAVKLAEKKTRPGRSCVLSPAAASYGIFKNFEERGEVFQRLVKG